VGRGGQRGRGRRGRRASLGSGSGARFLSRRGRLGWGARRGRGVGADGLDLAQDLDCVLWQVSQRFPFPNVNVAMESARLNERTGTGSATASTNDASRGSPLNGFHVGAAACPVAHGADSGRLGGIVEAGLGLAATGGDGLSGGRGGEGEEGGDILHFGGLEKLEVAIWARDAVV